MADPVQKATAETVDPDIEAAKAAEAAQEAEKRAEVEAAKVKARQEAARMEAEAKAAEAEKEKAAGIAKAKAETAAAERKGKKLYKLRRAFFDGRVLIPAGEFYYFKEDTAPKSAKKVV